MAKNTGRDYELLTQVLLNQIHQQKGVQNLTVEHDVKNLQGAILKMLLANPASRVSGASNCV